MDEDNPAKTFLLETLRCGGMIVTMFGIAALLAVATKIAHHIPTV